MSNVIGTIQEIAYYIPPKYRKAIYAVLLTACLLVTLAMGGLVAGGYVVPKWLIAINAALTPLSAGGHYLAKRNVAPETPSVPR